MFACIYAYTRSWVVTTQIWVKYGQTQMLRLKMQLKNVQLKVKVEFGLKFETTQHCLEFVFILVLSSY